MKITKNLIVAFALLVAAPALALRSTTATRNDYVANGSTAAFTFTFPVSSGQVVDVQVNGVEQGSGFTVSLNADQSASPGGSVTFLAAPIAGYPVRIQRVAALTQSTHFGAYSAFPAKTMESSLDAIVDQVQQVDRDRADVAASVSGEAAARAAADTQLNAQIGTQLAAVRGLNGNTTVADTATVLATGASAARQLKDVLGDELSIVSFGAACNGSTNDAPALTAAASAAASRGVGLIVACKLRLTTGAGTVSVPVRFAGGGSVDLQAGGSVGLYGEITSGHHQIFYMNGGSLSLGASVHQVFPQWFGALVNGSHNDAPAIQAALDAAWLGGSSGPTVILGAGVWASGAQILLRSGVNIVGASARYTIVHPTISSGSAFYADGAISGLGNQTLSGFMLDGVGATGSARALYVQNGGNNHAQFEKLWFTNWAGASMKAAVRIEGSTQQIAFVNCRFLGNKRHVEIVRVNADVWAPSHSYAANTYATADSAATPTRLYQVVTGGTSNASPTAGPTGTGVAIADGTVVWKYMGDVPSGDTVASGYFPTTVTFDKTTFEEAVGDVTVYDAAVLIVDSQAVHFRDCLFESNHTLFALWIQATARSASTDEHLIQNTYFEGNSCTGSPCVPRIAPANGASIYLNGVSGHPVRNVRIIDNEFHGTAEYDRIQVEYTAGTYIAGNTGGGTSGSNNRFVQDNSGAGTHDGLLIERNVPNGQTNSLTAPTTGTMNPNDRGTTTPISLTPGADYEVQRFATTFVGNQVVNLVAPGTVGAAQRQRFRIVRTGLGAFTLTVNDNHGNPLKVIANSTAAFVDVTWDGFEWRLTGYGTL